MPDELESIYQAELCFNGINAVTGEYGLRPMTSERLARLIQGKAEPGEIEQVMGHLPGQTLTDEQKHLEAEDEKAQRGVLQDKLRRKQVMFDAPAKEGVNALCLNQAGWAAIFPAGMATERREAIQQALKPLLDLRQEQTGDLFKILEDWEGYQAGERMDQFFKRQEPLIKPGPADPTQLPFYTLLVGNPEEIPYAFQYQLDVMRGVGRIDFGDDLDAYASYAQSVVMAETDQVRLPRRAALFGVAIPDDRTTQLSAQYLIQPLYDNLQIRKPPAEIEIKDDWQFDLFIREQASRDQLARLLGGEGEQTPALLMMASHGMEFPQDDAERQVRYNGALLCQDWPGPGSRIERADYFAGQDVTGNMLGLVALFYACYGAGTPQLDQFARQAFKTRAQIAPHSFVADLPKRMLSHGALAVLGHVERAWACSYVSPGGKIDNQAFVTALRKLLNGEPVGLATDPSFNMRYADMGSALSANLEELEWTPGSINDQELAHMWMANNDARGYVVIGDPAVRIPFARPHQTPTQHPARLDTGEHTT